jgi:hypothetical protein
MYLLTIDIKILELTKLHEGIIQGAFLDLRANVLDVSKGLVLFL